MKTWIAFAGVVIGAHLATQLIRGADADGIPQQDSMFYSGTFEENGALVEGARNVQLALWDHAMDTAATHRKCIGGAYSATLVKGRFRVPFDTACVDAIHADPDLWVEVLIDGASLGRTKLGVVPYAAEAGRASEATGTLATQLVPKNAVMYFDGTACPAGWTELVAAQGRYLVGRPAGGTIGSTVGTALSNNENRAVGQHGHGITDPGHGHGVSDPGHGHGVNDPGHSHTLEMGYGPQGGSGTYWDWAHGNFAGNAYKDVAPKLTGISIAGAATGISINGAGTNVSVQNAGSVAGTNAPYVQLLACKKS